MKNIKRLISFFTSHKRIRNWLIILLTLFILFALTSLFGFYNFENYSVSTIITGETEEKVEVKSGDTLSSILSEFNVSGKDAAEIATLLKKADHPHLRPNLDTLKVITKGSDDKMSVDKLTLEEGPWKSLIITKNDKNLWVLETVENEKQVRVVRKDGEIQSGDSFYYAGVRNEIPMSVLSNMYDLLSFDIDFERDVHVGQKFSVLYEEYYNEKGYFVGTGSIVYLSYGARTGDINMYRYKNKKGNFGYYDDNGKGAQKSLKKTPINNAKVTSKFNLKRKHPVLGYTRAHRGVDFRASTGTPIPAAGAGKIVKKTRDRGYGNYIRIRHNGTYETLYGHMSAFKKGVNVGSYVRQGQIVGYVGSTGMSTGPHLHYEIIKNGVKVNPMTIKLPSIDNLANNEKPDFLAFKSKIDQNFAILGRYPKMFVQLPVKNSGL